MLDVDKVSDFISHSVQIKHIIALEKALDIVFISHSVQIKLKQLGASFFKLKNFISHSVQIKLSLIPVILSHSTILYIPLRSDKTGIDASIPYFATNFISHSVQIKLKKVKQELEELKNFISHSVQIKRYIFFHFFI